MFAWRNQLHMYSFSNIVNLLSSAPGTASLLIWNALLWVPKTQVTIKELKDL